MQTTGSGSAASAPWRRVHVALVAAAVLVGLLVRLPGVFWGDGFGGGFAGHHPDEWTHVVNVETLLAPSKKPRWPPHPYPKGLAAPVAVPLFALQAGKGQASELPHERTILIAGRLESVLFGAATVLLAALLAARLGRDRRVAVLAAWLTALGGLHVSQSHMFVSDVAAIFWWLLAALLMLRELERRDGAALRWAALACGVGFGLKLTLAPLPSLLIVAWLGAPRVRRLVDATAFGIAGFVLVNLGSYTLYELARTVVHGTGDPYVFDRFRGALLHVLELPRLVGLPAAALGVVGAALLARRLLRERAAPRTRAVAVAVLLPLLVHTFFLLVKLDHFPRHLVPYVPWLAIAGGWALVRLADAAARRGVPPAVTYAVPLLWTAAFVYDGERVYVDEPRNAAAAWMLRNVEPGTPVWWKRHKDALPYEHVRFPEVGRPPFLVIEMLDANHYLSGVDFRDSTPRDWRSVHDAVSEERVREMQDLWRGRLEYREVARFEEGYFMPEYVLTDRLLGDRSRNYVSTIVVFAAQRGTPADGR